MAYLNLCFEDASQVLPAVPSIRKDNIPQLGENSQSAPERARRARGAGSGPPEEVIGNHTTQSAVAQARTRGRPAPAGPRRGRAQGRASVGCSRGAGAAPSGAVGTCSAAASLARPGTGKRGVGVGNRAEGTSRGLEGNLRLSPRPHSLFPCACCPLVRSPPSPQPRAQIVAPPGLAPRGGETPESWHAGTKPLPGGSGPLQPRGSAAPSPVCGEARRGWGLGSLSSAGTPVSGCLSLARSSGSSKKREAGRCFAGVRAGAAMGRGGPAGWGPGLRDAPPARVGEARARVSGSAAVRDAGSWGRAVSSVRRVSLPSGTGLPARMGAAPWVRLAGAGACSSP